MLSPVMAARTCAVGIRGEACALVQARAGVGAACGNCDVSSDRVSLRTLPHFTPVPGFT